MTKLNFLKNLGLEKFNSGVSTGAEWLSGNGTLTESVSPTDSSVIANVQNANREDYETLISKAQQAFPEAFFAFWNSFFRLRTDHSVRTKPSTIFT